MGTRSIWHWALVAIVALLLFGGRGKLSGLMGDAAKGIKAFKDGLKDTDSDKASDERAGALPRTNAEKEDLKS
ncbi:MAG: twin-arginine translocase TatA/TatE family subunit [bacterium]